MALDWLAERRTEVAAERILDAADELFTRQDAATVGMSEVAMAAGCSRATLYRYFECRDALYTAYVHRETNRVFRDVGERIAAGGDPAERLVDAVMASLHAVRESPSLSSWFTPTKRPIGGEMAERSEIIGALTEAYLRALGVDDVERRARWVVRILVSLLVFPGRDDADERAMLEEFVSPVVMSTRTGPAH
ncbi:TetR/AcrR family transcriptional regulator [Mycolicibacterium hodleri]|uniref:TetR/AcrR family transcriptional regulator n=1 Tax=Mycolicibacterium hodleri TaxID=49897 RepID=A0A502EHS1_9MYCO|nr:TetR/AcrR family transcriptional regulator [Mycolicibacterium hodleri]TPG36046.1 TetR/AcrR family transcriptional regulator [Mycolicibacterium hodleri]